MNIVSGSSYLTSLKDKEFFILRKLCSDLISTNEKRKLEKELEEIRLEIKKLGWDLAEWMCHICMKKGTMKKLERLHLCASCFDNVTKLMKTKPRSVS